MPSLPQQLSLHFKSMSRIFKPKHTLQVPSGACVLSGKHTFSSAVSPSHLFPPQLRPSRGSSDCVVFLTYLLSKTALYQKAMNHLSSVRLLHLHRGFARYVLQDFLVALTKKGLKHVSSKVPPTAPYKLMIYYGA